MALPIAGEIHRRLSAHRQFRHAAHLSAVIDAAVILTPCRFLSVPQEVRTGDVVMMTNLGTRSREKYSSAMFVQAPSRLYAS